MNNTEKIINFLETRDWLETYVNNKGFRSFYVSKREDTSDKFETKDGEPIGGMYTFPSKRPGYLHTWHGHILIKFFPNDREHDYKKDELRVYFWYGTEPNYEKMFDGFVDTVEDVQTALKLIGISEEDLKYNKEEARKIFGCFDLIDNRRIHIGDTLKIVSTWKDNEFYKEGDIGKVSKIEKDHITLDFGEKGEYRIFNSDNLEIIEIIKIN